jgi:hypothetical protein
MQVHVVIYLISDCVLFHEPIDGSSDSLAISIVKKKEKKKKKKKKKNVLKPRPIVPGLRV